MSRNRTTSVEKEKQLLGNAPAGPGTDASGVVDPPAVRRRHARPLARRIMTWSGNSLATCVIVMLGLTFGKQVLRWWRGDPPVVSISSHDPDIGLQGMADPSLPSRLAFGDLPMTFDRRLFVGDEDAALAQLRNSCRVLAIDFDARQQEPLPVSESLLRQLASREPVERGPRWRIVQSGGPIITVVALRMAPATSPDQANAESQRAESVVSWGLGLRAAETAAEGASSLDRWTLFTCSGRSQAVESDWEFSLPIPPGSQRSVAVRGAKGDALIGFAGKGTAASNKEFFDQSFGKLGWSRATSWSQVGTAWHARFQKRDSSVCDVQILDNADGDTSGILTTTSAVQDAEK